jgi:hypothetical protein
LTLNPWEEIFPVCPEEQFLSLLAWHIFEILELNYSRLVTADQVVENKGLRRIFGLKRRKVAVSWRKVQNEELND